MERETQHPGSRTIDCRISLPRNIGRDVSHGLNHRAGSPLDEIDFQIYCSCITAFNAHTEFRGEARGAEDLGFLGGERSKTELRCCECLHKICAGAWRSSKPLS